MTTMITATNARYSEFHDDGRDVDVTVRIGDRILSGEVTLLPAENGGGYSSWGSPDHWVEGNLLAALRGMDDARYTNLLEAIAREAGAVADFEEIDMGRE